MWKLRVDNHFHFGTMASSKRNTGHPMDIKAEVAGSIFEIVAVPGTAVARGETLLILESMKMEIVVSAPVAGVVAELLVQPDEVVDAGQVLARLTPQG